MFKLEVIHLVLHCLVQISVAFPEPLTFPNSNIIIKPVTSAEFVNDLPNEESEFGFKDYAVVPFDYSAAKDVVSNESSTIHESLTSPVTNESVNDLPIVERKQSINEVSYQASTLLKSLRINVFLRISASPIFEEPVTDLRNIDGKQSVTEVSHESSTTLESLSSPETEESLTDLPDVERKQSLDDVSHESSTILESLSSPVTEDSVTDLPDVESKPTANDESYETITFHDIHEIDAGSIELHPRYRNDKFLRPWPVNGYRNDEYDHEWRIHTFEDISDYYDDYAWRRNIRPLNPRNNRQTKRSSKSKIPPQGFGSDSVENSNEQNRRRKPKRPMKYKKNYNRLDPYGWQASSYENSHDVSQSHEDESDEI